MYRPVPLTGLCEFNETTAKRRVTILLLYSECFRAIFFLRCFFVNDDYGKKGLRATCKSNYNRLKSRDRYRRRRSYSNNVIMLLLFLEIEFT